MLLKSILCNTAKQVRVFQQRGLSEHFVAMLIHTGGHVWCFSSRTMSEVALISISQGETFYFWTQRCQNLRMFPGFPCWIIGSLAINSSGVLIIHLHVPEKEKKSILFSKGEKTGAFRTQRNTTNATKHQQDGARQEWGGKNLLLCTVSCFSYTL